MLSLALFGSVIASEKISLCWLPENSLHKLSRMPQTQFEKINREIMVDIILGSLLIFAAVVFAALLALFVFLWPLQKKREHDYWCHRQNIAHGHDHGNQEPHVV